MLDWHPYIGSAAFEVMAILCIDSVSNQCPPSSVTVQLHQLVDSHAISPCFIFPSLVSGNQGRLVALHGLYEPGTAASDKVLASVIRNTDARHRTMQRLPRPLRLQAEMVAGKNAACNRVWLSALGDNFLLTPTHSGSRSAPSS